MKKTVVILFLVLFSVKAYSEPDNHPIRNEGTIEKLICLSGFYGGNAVVHSSIGGLANLIYSYDDSIGVFNKELFMDGAYYGTITSIILSTIALLPMTGFSLERLLGIFGSAIESVTYPLVFPGALGGFLVCRGSVFTGT